MDHQIENQRPIAVFDSGLGGLTVVNALRRELPQEDLIYLGDTARVPYGNKGVDTVTNFTRECLDWLHGRGVKMMVVACNTASALALPSLINEYEEPILGVIEPGIRGALPYVKKGPVGVIGTHATIGSHAYGHRLSQIQPHIEVMEQACPIFVPLVEEGWFHHPITEMVVQEYLGSMRAKSLEVLILGCTHYPLLKDALGRFFGEETLLIDSAEETAKEVVRILDLRKMRAIRQGLGQIVFYCTDDPQRLAALGSRVFRGEIQMAQLVHVVKEGT